MWSVPVAQLACNSLAGFLSAITVSSCCQWYSSFLCKFFWYFMIIPVQITKPVICVCLCVVSLEENNFFSLLSPEFRFLSSFSPLHCKGTLLIFRTVVLNIQFFGGSMNAVRERRGFTLVQIIFVGKTKLKSAKIETCRKKLKCWMKIQCMKSSVSGQYLI